MNVTVKYGDMVVDLLYNASAKSTQDMIKGLVNLARETFEEDLPQRMNLTIILHSNDCKVRLSDDD